MSAIQDFVLVAKHYQGIPHQTQALAWLWEQTPLLIKEEFTKQWRAGAAPAPAPAPAPASGPLLTTEALKHMKDHEGFRTHAYLCPARVWTIGYGTTRLDHRAVQPGDVVTSQEAERLFQRDIELFSRGVLRLVRVPLTNNQFSALVSFAYNVGIGALQSSTLLRVLNSGDYKGAADQLLRWTRGNGMILPGLVRRRKEERQLFLKP